MYNLCWNVIYFIRVTAAQNNERPVKNPNTENAGKNCSLGTMLRNGKHLLIGVFVIEIHVATRASIQWVSACVVWDILNVNFILLIIN